MKTWKRLIFPMVLTLAAGSAVAAEGPDFLNVLLRKPTPTFALMHNGEPEDEDAEPTGYDKALEWRRLTLLDEHGHFNPRGQYEANLHRRAHVKKTKPKGGSAFTTTSESLTWWQWTSRGPDNVGGRTKALLVHPTNGQILYAGAAGGGIWSSSDGGASWYALTDFMGNMSISALAFDGLYTSTMYAGTGEDYYGDSLQGAGIFKSTDSGWTWTQLSATATWPAIHVLASQPSTNGVVLAGNVNGIYRTADGGASWTKSTITPNNPNRFFTTSIVFAPNGNDVYAVGEDDLTYTWTALYSNDGGITFHRATMPTSTTEMRLQYAPSSPSTIYVLRAPSDLFKSVDSGHTYQLVSTNSTNMVVQGDTSALWVCPTNPNLLVVGGLDLWRSTDGGASFTRISEWWRAVPGGPEPHADHHALASIPGNPLQLYDGNDGGVYKAYDITAAYPGSNWWQNRNSGYQTTQFYNAAGDAGTLGPFLGGTQDNGTLMTSQQLEGSPYRPPNSAKQPYGGDGGWVAIDPTNSFTSYFEAQNLDLNNSFNLGNTRNFIAGGIGDRYVDTNGYFVCNCNFIAPFILDPNNSATLLAAGADLWRSTNANTYSPTWTSIRPALTNTFGYKVSISAIAVAPSDSNVIWVGLNDGRIQKTINGLLPSPVWTFVDNGTNINPLPDRYVTSIYIDPANSNAVYVTFGGFFSQNLWRTLNGGATWTNLGGATLPPAPMRSFTRHPRNLTELYLATDVGVYTSSDAGATWTTTDQGPNDAAIDSISFVHGQDMLLAGSHGRGLWTYDTSGVTTLAPTGLTAIANGTSSVSVSWSPVSGATSYQLLRSSNGAAFVPVGGTITGTSYLDTAVAPNTTYLYKAMASVSGMNTQAGNVDLATTTTFTLDNALAGQIIAATHLQEIRNAVNYVRIAAGKPVLTFAQAAVPGLVITGSDIAALRSGLNEAYTAIGITPPTYSESIISVVTIVKAQHFQEIRNAVK